LRKPKALFLIHGNHMLIPNNARKAFEDLLSVKAGLDLTVADHWAELTPERLEAYDLVVSCAGGALFRYPPGTAREANDKEVGALLGAVEGGTPFVGLHCSSLMFMNQFLYRQPISHAVANPDPKDLLPMFQTRYLEMIGNAVLSWPEEPVPNNQLSATQLRYLEMIGLNFLTDDGLEPTTINIIDRAHPITHGIADFEISDECYHMVGNRSKLHVLAEARGWPLIWNHRWGAGKVHYNALGHDNSGATDPNFQRLVVQAMAWALEMD